MTLFLSIYPLFILPSLLTTIFFISQPLLSLPPPIQVRIPLLHLHRRHLSCISSFSTLFHRTKTYHRLCPCYCIRGGSTTQPAIPRIKPNRHPVRDDYHPITHYYSNRWGISTHFIDVVDGLARTTYLPSFVPTVAYFAISTPSQFKGMTKTF